MIYVQKDGNSTGMRVSLVKAHPYSVSLKMESNGQVYLVSAVDFYKHYRNEDGTPIEHMPQN